MNSCWFQTLNVAMRVHCALSILNIVWASVCLSPTVVMKLLCASWLVLLLGVQLIFTQLEDLDDDADDDDDVEDKRNGRNKNKPVTSNVIPKNNGKYYLQFNSTNSKYIVSRWLAKYCVYFLIKNSCFQLSTSTFLLVVWDSWERFRSCICHAGCCPQLWHVKYFDWFFNKWNWFKYISLSMIFFKTNEIDLNT